MNNIKNSPLLQAVGDRKSQPRQRMVHKSYNRPIPAVVKFCLKIPGSGLDPHQHQNQMVCC